MRNMNPKCGVAADDADPKLAGFNFSNEIEIPAPTPLEWPKGGVSRGAVLRDLLNSEQWRVRFLVVYDALIAGLAVKMGYALSPAYDPIYQEATRHLDVTTAIPLFAVTFLLVAFVWGMYESKRLESTGSAIIPAVGAVATTWGLLILVDYTVTYSAVGRWIVAISALGLCAAAVLPRIVLHLLANDS